MIRRRQQVPPKPAKVILVLGRFVGEFDEWMVRHFKKTITYKDNVYEFWTNEARYRLVNTPERLRGYPHGTEVIVLDTAKTLFDYDQMKAEISVRYKVIEGPTK